MKRYITPDMELLILQADAITTNSLPMIDTYDSENPALNPDSPEYDPAYARNVGLL